MKHTCTLIHNTEDAYILCTVISNRYYLIYSRHVLKCVICLHCHTYLCVSAVWVSVWLWSRLCHVWSVRDCCMYMRWILWCSMCMYIMHLHLEDVQWLHSAAHEPLHWVNNTSPPSAADIACFTWTKHANYTRGPWCALNHVCRETDHSSVHVLRGYGGCVRVGLWVWTLWRHSTAEQDSANDLLSLSLLSRLSPLLKLRLSSSFLSYQSSSDHFICRIQTFFFIITPFFCRFKNPNSNVFSEFWLLLPIFEVAFMLFRTACVMCFMLSDCSSNLWLMISLRMKWFAFVKIVHELLRNFLINTNSEGHFFNLPMSPAFFPSFWLLPAADGWASPPPLPQCTGAQVGVKHERYCGLCVQMQLTCSHIYTFLWETNFTKWKLCNSNQNDSDSMEEH